MKNYKLSSVFLIIMFAVTLSACSEDVSAPSSMENEQEKTLGKYDEESRIESGDLVQDEIKKISVENFLTHNSPEDCYVTTDGYVYNISAFLDEHPKPLDEYCGSLDDFTKAFRSQHANEKDDKIRGFLIGILE